MSNAAEINIAEGARRCPTKLEEYVKKWVAKTKKEGGLGADAIPPSSVSLRRNTSDAARKDNSDRNAHQQRALLVATSANTNTNKSDVGRVELASSTRGYLPSPLEMVFDMTGKYNSSNPNSNSAEGERRISTRRQKEEDAKEQKEKKKTSSPLTCMPVCSNHNNRKGTAILYHSKVTRHRRHAPQSDYDKLANIFSKRRVLLDALIEEIGSEMKRCCGGPTSSVSSSSLLFAAKKTSSPRGSRIMRQHQQRRNNVNLAATTTKSDNSDHCHQHTPIMNESSSLPGLRQAFPFLVALFANDASMYVVNNGNNSNNNNSSSNGYPSSFVASSADRNSSSSQTTASVSHENAANNTNSHDESGTNNNSGGELRQHHVVFTTDLTTHQQLVNTILWHFRRVRDTILSHQEASVRRCIRVVDGDDVEFERPERVERTWEHLLACGLPQMCGLKCYAPEEDPAVVLALEEEEKQIAIALAAAAAERNAALLTTVAQQELALGENNTNPAGGALGDIDGDNANSSGKSVTKSATHQHEENNEDDADDDDDDLAKLMMAAFDEIADKGEMAAVEEEASRSEKQQGHHKENDTIIAFPSSISKSTSSRHPLLQDMHAFKLAPAKTKVLQLVHDRDHIEMVDDVAVELGRARMAKIADVQRIITAAEKRIKELLLCDADETAESISDFIFRKILSSASNANNASLLGLLGNNSSATALTSSSSGPLSSSSASSGSTSMASIVPMTSLKPSAIYALRTELADFFRLVLLDAAEAVAKTLAPLDSQGTLPPPSSAMMPLPSLSSSPSSPFLSATTTTITNAGGGVFGASSSVTSVLPEMQPFGITIGQDLYASDGTAQAARLAAGGVVHLALEICKPDSEAEVALDKQSIDDDENEDNNNNRKKSKKNKSNNNKNNLGIINGNPSDLRTVQNGFALVRPPGHHSGAERASGFCFFNNVAVAARAAQAQFPNRIKKVLIIDWDVHHGDGTEEIFSDDPNVMCFSVHQYGAKLGHVVRHRSSVAGKLAKKRAAAAADASKCLDRLDRDASGQRREFLKTEAARVLSDAVMTRHLSSPAHLPLSSIPSGIHTPHLAPLSSSPTLLVNAADPTVTFDGSAQNEDDNLAPCHRVTQFRRKKRQREVQEGKVEQREQHTAAETTTATDKKERVEEEEEENKRVSTEDKKETSGSKERGEVSGDLKKEKGAAVAVAIPSSSSLPTTASQPKELRTKEEEKEKENIITITVKKEVENASSAPNMNANVEPPSIHHEIKADNGSQPAVAAAPASQLSLAEELALINASGRRTRPKQQQQQQQVLSAAAIHGDNLAVDQQQQQVTAFTHKEKEGGEALAPQASTLVEEKEKEESHQQVRVEHEEDPLLAYFGSALKGADGSGKKKNNKNTNGAATGGPSSASESSSSSSGPSRSDLGSSSSSSSSESSSTSDDDDDNSDTTSSADQSAESTDSFLINADGGQNNIVINTRNDEEGSTPTPPLLLAEGAKMTITVPNTAVAAAVTAAAPPLLTRVLLKDKREPKMNHSGWVSNTEDFDDYNYQGAMRTHGGGGGGGGAAMMMGRSMRGNGGASQSSFNPIQANGNRNATVFPGDGSGRGSNASEEDDLHTYNGSRSPSLSSVPSSLFLVCEDNEDDKDAAIDEKNENGKKRRRGRRLEESPDKNEGKQMLRKKRDNRDDETPASKKRNGLSSSFGDPQLRLNPKYEGRLVPRLTEQGGSPHSRRSGGANAANTSSVTINESAFELDYCNGNGCTMFEGGGNNSDYLQKQREPPTARSSYHANLLPRRIENVHPSFWRFAQKREKQAAFYPGTGALDVVGNDAPSGRWLKVKQNGRKRSRHSGGSSGKRKGDAAMANKSNRTEHDIGLNDSDNEGSSDPNSSRSSSPSSSSLSKSDGEDNTDDNDEAAVAAAPAAGLTVNAPWPCHGFGDIEYLQLFNSLLLPMMDEFEPDLVIVACGFDSAKEDNLGSMQMTPSGYYYLTRLLMKHFEARKLRWEEENKRKQSEQKISFVSSSSSTATKDDLPPVPRLVVALEGGYNLKNVALGSEAVLRALMEESSDGQKLHELESQRRAFEEWVGKRHQYNAKVRRMQERALRETERLLSAANNRRGKHVLREAVASSPNDENDNNVVHAAQNYIALPGTKAQLTEQNHPDREDPARERVTKKTRFEEALKVASLLPPPPEIPRELLVAGNGAQRGEGRVPSLFYTHFARNRMLFHQCRELVKKVQEAHAPYWRHLKQ